MQPLTGLDSAFLYLETPTAHMHAVVAVVLEPSRSPEGYTFPRIRSLIRSHLHRVPVLRQRLRSVPFGLGHPVWVVDDHFVLENHLHRVALPAPGSPRELAEIVGHVASIPLDREHPLWELWAVEGLEGGGVALLLKLHHAVIDGVAGADLLARLLDVQPGEADDDDAGEPWRPEPEPGAGTLLRSALRWSLSQPARFARVALGTGRSVADLGLSALGLRGESVEHAALPFTAPPTPFSRSIGPRRTVAFGQASLLDVKGVKNAFGTTVNDVVLAACCYSLRRYLDARGCLPDRPLVATVPVSVREAGEARPTGNRVSSMFVYLPVQIADPVSMLEEIARDTKDSKKVQQAFGANILQDWAQLAPPTLIPLVSQLYSSLKLADRHRPVHNLVISNVPGPRSPLYVGGVRVGATYPFGPVLEGAGLNITVLSYRDAIDFGAIACQECVPDPQELARGFEEGVGALKRASLRALRQVAASS